MTGRARHAVESDEPLDVQDPLVTESQRLEALVHALSVPGATSAAERVLHATAGASATTRSRLARAIERITFPSLSTQAGLVHSLVLVATGSSTSAMEFDRGWGEFTRAGVPVPPAVIDAFARAVAQRGEEWLTRLCNARRSFGRFGSWSPQQPGYELFRCLADSGAIAADNRDFLEAAALTEDPAEGLTAQFWARFHVAGLGCGRYARHPAISWDEAIIAAATDAATRDRLLDVTVEALDRGFSAYDIEWYLHVITVLSPTDREIAARESRWLDVLATAPYTAVSLAQSMLLRIADELHDVGALLRASPIVLARKEKKIRLAHLALLSRVVTRLPDRSMEVRQIVSPLLDSTLRDVRETATALVGEADNTGALREGTSIAVSPPHRTTGSWTEPAAPDIADADELAALLVDVLEHPAPPVDIIRVQAAVERLASTTPSDSDALRDAARRHLSRDPEIGASHLSLPMHLAQMALAWLGELDVVRVHVGAVHQYPPRPTTPMRTPLILLILSLQATTERLLGRAPTMPDPTPSLRHLRSSEHDFDRNWIRDAIGLWVAVERHHDTHLDPRLIDPPRSWAGDEIAEWRPNLADLYALLAYYLARHPDLLAAHVHPALRLAVGLDRTYTGALVTALGATRSRAGAPFHAAMSLAASARHPEMRQRAAESIADLSARGILIPEEFAAQLGILAIEPNVDDPLGRVPNERMIVASRVAETLEAAASASPLAGWRVLETLTALLPRLDGVTGAPRLVLLAADLALDFGVAVDLPAVLEPHARTPGAMGAALRRLSTSTARPTDRARAAAAQADLALRDC